MYRENHYYGHADVLAAYCGTSLRPIAGSLQHGWMPGTGIAGEPPPTRWSKLVWSARNLQASRDEGIEHVVPVGAPYLYLPAAQAAPPRRGADSLLAFPFHGWEKDGVASVERSLETYATALEELRSDGFGPITVCMYHLEHARPELRAIFERRGHDVVTAGARDGNPEFLTRIRDMILAHGHITSNRVATATMYALHSGRPVCIAGPEPLLEGEVAAGTGRIRAWEREHFPGLMRDRYDGTPDVELGRKELGAEFQQSPETLARLLGWAGRGYLETLGLRVDVAVWHTALRLSRRLRGR